MRWLTTFLRDRALTRPKSFVALSRVFVVAFAGQGVVAGLVAALLVGLAPRAASDTRPDLGARLDLVDVTLLVVAVGHVAVAVVTGVIGVRSVRSAAQTGQADADDDLRPTASARSAAIGAVTAFAVLGSTTLWFAAFAFVTSAPAAVTITLLGLAMVAYAGGFVHANAIARAMTEGGSAGVAPAPGSA